MTVFLLLAALAADRPNVLWITAEDMGPTLGCYGDAYADTPRIDALAEQGTRFTHAFATAPVCSPARACLIHGVSAPTQGTHQMRSSFPLPEGMNGFPALLRKAGYWTSNDVKTDYNTSSEPRIIATSWDRNAVGADWTGRAEGQPFFGVINLMTTHQSRTMVWPREQFVREVQGLLPPGRVHDPANAPVPPYYPDTPLVRQTIARHYDCVSVMDLQVGAILDRLEADGLADDTIVFFFSDHGSGLPRHKRALLDTGTHVPLIVRCPEKWRARLGLAVGATDQRLLDFSDFAPTALAVAGVTAPGSVTGTNFLTPGLRGREYVFGHRDRVDEWIDMARSVRGERFLYVRNYLPHAGYHQPSAWPDQGIIRAELERVRDAGELTAAQRHYLAPTRPVEELYDCVADPLNLTNLAADAGHVETLDRMRQAHREHALSARDLGYLPEIEQVRIAADAIPVEWAATDAYDLPTILDAAWDIGTAPPERFVEHLAAGQSAVRYWGAIGLRGTASLPAEGTDALTAALKDESIAVRIAAAEALVHHGQPQPALTVLAGLFRHDEPTVALYAARAAEMLGDKAVSLRPDLEKLLARYDGVAGDLPWFIRFTTRASLGLPFGE